MRAKLKPLGIKICLQYHDELLSVFLSSYKEEVKGILAEAMADLNETLGLNVSINIDTQFGNNYAECH